MLDPPNCAPMRATSAVSVLATLRSPPTTVSTTRELSVMPPTWPVTRRLPRLRNRILALAPIPSRVAIWLSPPSVTSKPEGISRLPPTTRPAPLCVIEPAVSVTRFAAETWSGCVTARLPPSCSRRLPAPSVIGALSTMLVPATSSSPPAGLFTAASMVMVLVASSRRLAAKPLMKVVPIVALAGPSPVPSTPSAASPSEPPTPATMVRFTGSIRKVPAVPPSPALTRTVPVTESPRWPETSTKPPSPPCGPPLAEISPAWAVYSLELTMTRPPAPRSVASARSTAPCATPVRRERRPGAVPTAIPPPPARPEASTSAPGAIQLRSPTTSMVPPRVPAARPWAETLPSIRTVPPVPAITTRPARPLAASVSAVMRPPARTRSCTMPSTAAAVR